MRDYSKPEFVVEEEIAEGSSRAVIASIFLVVISLISITVGVLQQNSENHKIVVAQQAIVAADAAAAADASRKAAAIAWIPPGYTAFTINPDVAQDQSANPTCSSTSSKSGKYCWTYQIATKSDCHKVVATLDLTNGSSVVASVTGEVDNVTAETPTVLEVDSKVANDGVVNDSTQGKLTAIVCN